MESKGKRTKGKRSVLNADDDSDVDNVGARQSLRQSLAAEGKQTRECRPHVIY